MPDLKGRVMNKKVVIIASAVIAFFAGAIWVSEVPTVATLVAFLEVCAGFGCGFFFKQVLDEEALKKYKEEVESLKAAQKAVAKEKKIRITTKKSEPKKAE